jgi:hypothetical protein
MFYNPKHLIADPKTHVLANGVLMTFAEAEIKMQECLNSLTNYKETSLTQDDCDKINNHDSIQG